MALLDMVMFSMDPDIVLVDADTVGNKYWVRFVKLSKILVNICGLSNVDIIFR